MKRPDGALVAQLLAIRGGILLCKQSCLVGSLIIVVFTKVFVDAAQAASGSPWEKGYCESFDGKLRDECLKLEIFYSLKEAQVIIGAWRD